MTKHLGSLLLIFIFSLITSPLFAGDTILVENNLPLQKQSTKKPLGLRSIYESKYKPFTTLKYWGYARAVFGYRNLSERYSTIPAKELVSFNGYDFVNNTVSGYQEPLILLRLEGNPTSKTFFRTQLAFNNQLAGIESGQSTNAASFQSANGLNASFTGGWNTSIGDFSLTAGSFNWYRMSPFTLWNYEYRDDMFERYPWEPEGIAFGRYDKYYVDQNIARDSRWGNILTQGFILEAKNLPLGFATSIFYGKSPYTGSYRSYLTRIPKNSLGTRIEKSLNKHKIGANFYSEYGYTDSTAIYKFRNQIITGDGRLNFDKVKIFVEGGMARFQDFVMAQDGYLNLGTAVPLGGYQN
ncbi:MAG: hypothetical protein K2X86_00075, partial [Cytophagaceae bacterium]|nr:hypothetical protein [Cytophagaceae bacterium]